MDIVATIAELRSRLDGLRATGSTVGAVPTMGYLHDGHTSLMRAAHIECDVVVASIFVNPLQFAPGEDLDAYPRDMDRDCGLADAAGVDVLFVPPVAEMYPMPVLTTVSVAEISSRFEGTSRPTHFAGVATVVAKLCNVFGPCRAYFGEKDYQQVAVVRRMASDLSFPVEIVACPTVREPDGLALSSRNVYLSDVERTAAPVLYQALQAGAGAVAAGERDPEVVRRIVADDIEAEPLAQLNYVGVVDAATLADCAPLAGEIRVLTAARFGRTRLLDNIGVTVPGR